MNFAEQIQKAAVEKEAKNSITITREEFERIADRVSSELVDELEQAAKDADVPNSLAPLATLMTNILLIHNISDALFGKEEDK